MRTYCDAGYRNVANEALGSPDTRDVTCLLNCGLPANDTAVNRDHFILGDESLMVSARTTDRDNEL